MSEAKSGPGPSSLVTLWGTESLLTHRTVPPFFTSMLAGMNLMSFMSTVTSPLPAGALLPPEGSAGLSALPPPPPPSEESESSPPQPATNTSTTHAIRMLSMRVMDPAYASTSSSSNAFWACRRFSAWSQIAERGAVEDALGDLLAGVGGQAVQRDRASARRASSASSSR